MIKLLFLSIVLFFIQIVPAQHNRAVNKYVEIHRLKKNNGKYLGTILGKSVRDSLYSDIIVIKKTKNSTDTLFTLSKEELCRGEGRGESVGRCYDAYGIELLKSDRFCWWMVKEDGPASDGQIICRNYSKKIFQVDNDEH
jgi:hypothetical protein